MTDQEKLEKLKEIKASGILNLSIDGQSITYRSMDELNQAIDELSRPRRSRATPTYVRSGYLDNGGGIGRRRGL
jgi:hypothetical protein